LNFLRSDAQETRASLTEDASPEASDDALNDRRLNL
jgi:hypothetical protein